jgi:hypothetical protein
MSTIITRAGKGTPLTHAEVDANFTNLNTDKAETAGPTFTGAVKVAAGTAAAPSLAISGDPNTGLYSPGADQVALATAGTGRLFVAANGNVGIGAAPGAYRLDVAGGIARILNQGAASALEIGQGTTTSQSAFVDLITDTTYTDYGLRLIRDNAGANAVSQLAHRGTSELRIATQEAAPISFWTTNLERARIDSSGRLLVGTSSARAFNNALITPRLQLEGLDVSQSAFGLARNSANTGGPVIGLGKSRGAVAGSMTAVITQDDLGRIQFQGADGAQLQQAAEISAHVDGTPGTDDMPGRLVFSTTADGAATPTERMRIDSAGRVGIGATSPSALLSVSASTATNVTAQIFLENTESGSAVSLVATGTSFSQAGWASVIDGVILRSNSSASGGLGLQAGASTSPITFHTGASSDERARIDSSGRLLVGTSTAIGVGSSAIPPFLLRTIGTAAAFVGDRTDAVGAVFSLGKSRSATIGGTTLIQNNDTLGEIRFAGADGVNLESYGASIACQVDGTPGTNDMPGRLVFSTTADGAGSPTERMRIDNQGRIGFNSTALGGQNGAYRFAGSITGNANSQGIVYTPTIQSDSTSNAVSIISQPSTASNGGTPYTIGSVTGFSSNQGTFSADSTVTNLYGFSATSNLIGATNNYGFSSNIAAATGRWNFYAAGTADSYFASNNFIFANGNTERARVDSSGRLLVGISTARSNFYNLTNITPFVQYEGASSDAQRSTSQVYGNAGNAGPFVVLAKHRGASTGLYTVVAADDELGAIDFQGADGSEFVTGVRIQVQVDGTPGLNDMPGRLVFSTTADGGASPTERMRITNDGVIAHDQPTPAAVNTTATLTVANLKAGIITSTSAAATDMTLPTGTDTQAGFSGTYDNMTFEWSVINTGPSLVRVLAGTAHTVVGSGSVATGTSGRFASRRTAANTFVTYRLS